MAQVSINSKITFIFTTHFGSLHHEYVDLKNDTILLPVKLPFAIIIFKEDSAEMIVKLRVTCKSAAVPLYNILGRPLSQLSFKFKKTYDKVVFLDDIREDLKLEVTCGDEEYQINIATTELPISVDSEEEFEESEAISAAVDELLNEKNVKQEVKDEDTKEPEQKPKRKRKTFNNTNS